MTGGSVKASPNSVHRKLFEHEQLKLQTITKSQRDLIVSILPVLQENRGLRLFFVYLARRSHALDSVDGGIIIPYRVLASFVEKDPDHCNTEQELLLPYIQQVSRNLQYRDYWHQGQKCRMITNSGISELVRKAFEENEGEKVYTYDMKPFNDRKLAEGSRRLRKTAKLFEWRYSRQAEIVSYLHSLPLKPFQETVELHIDEAYKVAHTLPNSEKHVETLRKIENMPLPFYYPGKDPSTKTPRIFGTAMQYLSKDIRKVLCPGWIDLDLRNCQLAIVGGIFQIASVQEVMKSGKSIWPELLEYMECPDGKQKQMKDYLKKGLYSMIFGMRKDNVENQIAENFENVSLEKNKTFTDYHILRDVDEALKNARRMIKIDGGMESAFGDMEYRRGEDIDSFVACLVQTYELDIIGAIYDVAAKEKKSCNETFRIRLHQHDGLAIEDNYEEDVLERLDLLVMIKALEHDIITGIEY